MKPARCTAWNDAAGSIAATIGDTGGATVTAWPLGWWPAPGKTCWVDEAGDGTWVCFGPRGGEGAWKPWTPTLTNLTLGNGTVNAAYRRIANNVEVRCAISFGTTTVFPGGLFTISLPTGITSKAFGQTIGCETFAAGTATFWGFAFIAASSNLLAPFAPTNTGTSAMTQIGGVGMTFGNSSAIVINGGFEVA